MSTPPGLGPGTARGYRGSSIIRPVASPLDDWKFLVGTWSGASKDQFGEKGVVETTATYALEPGDRFLTARGEAVCEGRLLNRSLSVMFYDSGLGRFRRKTFFSYGFVNNELEFERTDREIRFDVTVEPAVKQFEGIRWRSNLRRVSDREIATGLAEAKTGQPFSSYGEVMLARVESP